MPSPIRRTFPSLVYKSSLAFWKKRDYMDSYSRHPSWSPRQWGYPSLWASPDKNHLVNPRWFITNWKLIDQLLKYVLFPSAIWIEFALRITPKLQTSSTILSKLDAWSRSLLTSHPPYNKIIFSYNNLSWISFSVLK